MTETTETIINLLYIILLLGIGAFGARFWWLWENERRRAKRKRKEEAPKRAREKAKWKKKREARTMTAAHIHIPKVNTQKQLTAMRVAAHGGDIVTLTNIDYLGPLTEISRDYLSQQLKMLVGDHKPSCDPLEDSTIRAATHCALYAQAEGWLDVAQLLRESLINHRPKLQAELLDTEDTRLSPSEVLRWAVEMQVHHDNEDAMLPPMKELLGVELVPVEGDQTSLSLHCSRPIGWENWRWLSPVGSTTRLAVFSWLLLPLSALPIVADARTNLRKGPYPLRKRRGGGVYGRYLHDRYRDEGVRRCVNTTVGRAAANEIIRLTCKARSRSKWIDRRWNLLDIGS